MSKHLEGTELEEAQAGLDKLYISLERLTKNTKDGKKILRLVYAIVEHELDIEKECNR